jgi:hypothetical protein
MNVPVLKRGMATVFALAAVTLLASAPALAASR